MDSDRFKSVEHRIRAFGEGVHKLDNIKESMVVTNLQVKFMTDVEVKSLEFHIRCLVSLTQRLYFKNFLVCVE